MSDGSGAPTGPKRPGRQSLCVQVRSRRVVEGAWTAIKRNARTSRSPETRKEIEAFEADLSSNLRRIIRQLQQGKFVFAPSRGVKIPKDKRDKSKFRPLVVAKVECRIVQRAIHDVLVGVPSIEKFVYTPNSFGGVKKQEKQITAVPAAIKAVLEEVQRGARFAIRSDIEQFFTRIRKSMVIEIIRRAVDDQDFVELISHAIAVELANMAELRESARAFPIEDLGVAQGNSLSPLLGNLLLHQFDTQMNALPDVRCIRYIDDFVVLAPNDTLAEEAFDRAKVLLADFEMTTSERKTVRCWIDRGIEFLGIELANGLIRPSRPSRDRMLGSVRSTVAQSCAAFRAHRKSGILPNSCSLLESLQRIGGIIQGWGKHYWFCNDSVSFQNLDAELGKHLRTLLGTYRMEREKVDDAGRWRLLGIEALAQMERSPFQWPRKRARLDDAPTHA